MEKKKLPVQVWLALIELAKVIIEKINWKRKKKTEINNK